MLKLRADDLIIIERPEKELKFSLTHNEKKSIFMLLLDKGDFEGKIGINIQGDDAFVEIFGIVFGYRGSHIKLSSFQHHLGKRSTSSIFIKSILAENSSFNYQGTIRIEKTGDGTNAYEENKNLLIEEGKIDVVTHPYLEILTDDVNCGHAVATGRIDSKQLYYLQTRGLSGKDSRRLIINGFLEEIICQAPEGKKREQVQKIIKNKLGHFLESIS